jgi:integration host factor subunit beta
MNVTKFELCSRVAKRLDQYSGKISVNTYKIILEAILDEIFTITAEGHRIEIRGFGCYKTALRKKRTGRNPRTGVTVDIPGYTAPCFKFSKEAQKNFELKLLKIIDNTPD